MDSHVFRVIAGDLACVLSGARIQKIYGPHPDTFVFEIYQNGARHRLVFSWSRQFPCLFITAKAFDNPQVPRADVMRLRKHFSGKRINAVLSHYPSRRLGLCFDPKESGSAAVLLLDLRQGAFLLKAVPEDFLAAPLWPSKTVLSGLAFQGEASCGHLETPLWRDYPVLTPLLRESLGRMPETEAACLFSQLREGTQSLHVYVDEALRPRLLSAWLLPDALVRERRLHLVRLVLEEETMRLHFQGGEVDSADSGDVCALTVDGLSFPLLFSRSGPEDAALPRFALSIASFFQDCLLLSRQRSATQRSLGEPEKRRQKKTRALILKLEAEKKRMLQLMALQRDGLLLQGHLWRFASDEKRDFLWLSVDDTLALPDGQSKAESNLLRLSLNPRLSIRENMLWLFQQAAKGKRGLLHVQRRLDALCFAHSEEREGQLEKDAFLVSPQAEKVLAARSAERSGHKAGAGEGLEKFAAVFFSSDGFMILRGKNNQGNAKLLKLSRPHDLWLHSKAGPSAYGLIKRRFAGEDIPHRTLHEAAVLVGLKSWEKDAGKADIMYAQARHVRFSKNSAGGRALVERILGSLLVTLDADLEERLRI